MTVSGTLARPMMAGIFIYGGWDALRDPASKAKMADDVAPRIAEALGLPASDTVTLVRVNGGIQVVAGTMLALGRARRLSAAVLAASLIPTTYAGHRFWEEVDEDRRAQQRIHFLKNVAMLGGLVLAAADTGGRPSLPWQARRAAHHAAEVALAAGAATEGAARQVIDSTVDATKQISNAASRHGQTVLAADVAGRAHQVVHAVQESDIGRRAQKAARKAADKAMKKAKKGDFARSALKAGQQAAETLEMAARQTRRAVQKTEKAARKAQLTKRATRAAQHAELGQRATRAARKAAADIHQVEAQLAPQVRAAAAKVQEATADILEWAKDVTGDAPLSRAADTAATLVHHVAERTREGLPVAS